MSGKHWIGRALLAGAALATTVFGQAAQASGTVLRVGPGRAYTVPSQAAQAAQDGDTVEIDAGTYAGDVAVWSANHLTIRGVGAKRPVLDAQGNAAMGKGLWVIEGSDTTVENLEFTGAAVPDKNGAGIRLDGSGLTVSGCLFHDNEDGILTNAAPDGDVLVEDSEFSHNGQGDGYSHNLYIGHVRKFTLRGCYSHDAKIGHDVKSRAAVNDIRYNRISDDDASDSSFLVDLPNGGDCALVGNVLRRGPNASQSVLVSFAEEGASNPKQALSVVNNTLDNQRQNATFVRVSGPPTLKVVNNLFGGAGTWLDGGTVDTTTNKAATAGDFKDTAMGDYHLTPGSTAIGRGIPALDTDKDGLRYFTPPALGAYEGPRDAATDTHVLWTNPDGLTIFWDVNAQGARLVAGTYGPFADDASGKTDWAALSLSTGPDGASHLLWTNPDGHAALWAVQADGSYAPSFYGPFEDDGTSATIWKPVAVSTGGDGRTHVLWSNPNGRTILWDVDAQGGFAVVGDYDPQPGYTPLALATGVDGLSHVLWNGAGGKTLLWDLDANNQPTAHAYGPFSDDGTSKTLWSARALSVGPDGVPHVLWTNPNGRTILWDVAADGTFTIAGHYGPYQDDASGNTSYTAVALATGADGLSHLAWDNADGNTYLWSVQTSGAFTPTFYSPFLDAGSVWKAVAVSAAQTVSGRG